MIRRDAKFLFGAAWIAITVAPCLSQSNSYNPGQPFSFTHLGSMGDRPFSAPQTSPQFSAPQFSAPQFSAPQTFAPQSNSAPPSNINGAPPGQATFLQTNTAPPSNINGAPPGQATFLQSNSAPSDINGAPPGQATFLQTAPPQQSTQPQTTANTNADQNTHSHTKHKTASKAKVAAGGPGANTATALPQQAPPQFNPTSNGPSGSPAYGAPGGNPGAYNAPPPNYTAVAPNGAGGPSMDLQNAPTQNYPPQNNANYPSNGTNGSNGSNIMKRINWNGVSRAASNIMRNTGLNRNNGYYNPYGGYGYGGNSLNVLNNGGGLLRNNYSAPYQSNHVSNQQALDSIPQPTMGDSSQDQSMGQPMGQPMGQSSSSSYPPQDQSQTGSYGHYPTQVQTTGRY